MFPTHVRGVIVPSPVDCSRCTGGECENLSQPPTTLNLQCLCVAFPELDFTNTGGLPLQATSPQQRFGNAVAPSAGPPSPGGQGETIQLLPSPTTAPQGSSLLGGSSPQGGGNGSNASSTSSLTATSAERYYNM